MGVMVLGRDLADHREELFVIMVVDGLPMGEAYKRAGFDSKNVAAPGQLWSLDRCQQRAAAILEARRKTSAVTLPQVTDMLQRVYVKALHNENESAAHNAAFSLARLYGHITDRQQVDVVVRPSRDPDAPAEQALGAWVSSLPGQTIEGRALPGPEAGEAGGERDFGALSGPRAVPDAEGPPSQPENINNIRDLAGPEARALELNPDPFAEPSGLDAKYPNEINWLGGSGTGVGVASENGAPSRPVTGTPNPGARTGPENPNPGARTGPENPNPGARSPLGGPGPRGANKKTLSKTNRVPVPSKVKGKKTKLIPGIFK